MTTTDTSLDTVDAAQLVTRSGLPYHRLHQWTEKGYLRTTTGRANPGSGHDRTWPAAEADIARAMQRLIDAGLTTPAAHLVARGVTRLAPGVQVHVDPTEIR